MTEVKTLMPKFVLKMEILMLQSLKKKKEEETPKKAIPSASTQ